jgi:hypothetical protein
MAMVLTRQKPTQRKRWGELSEGLPGSTKSVGCVERSVRNLGDPSGSDSRKAGAQGIRILSHARGNPDTEVGRSLPATESPLAGKPCRAKTRDTEDPTGVRFADSTQSR